MWCLELRTRHRYGWVLLERKASAKLEHVFQCEGKPGNPSQSHARKPGGGLLPVFLQTMGSHTVEGHSIEKGNKRLNPCFLLLFLFSWVGFLELIGSSEIGSDDNQRRD